MAVSNAVGLTLGAGAAAAVFVAIVMIVPPQQPVTEDPQEAAAATVADVAPEPEASATEIASDGAQPSGEPLRGDEQIETADAVTESEAALPETLEAADLPENLVPADLTTIPPAFDNVRIVTDGADFSVIAGMAAAGAQIAIMLDDEVVATATADASGAFAELVMIAPSPQPRMLSLVADPDGSATRSDDTVLIAPTAPLVVAVLEPMTEGSDTGAEDVPAIHSPDPAEGDADDAAEGPAITVETEPAPDDSGVAVVAAENPAVVEPESEPVLPEPDTAGAEPAPEPDVVALEETEPSLPLPEPDAVQTATPEAVETAGPQDPVANGTVADGLETVPDATRPDDTDLAANGVPLLESTSEPETVQTAVPQTDEGGGPQEPTASETDADHLDTNPDAPDPADPVVLSDPDETVAVAVPSAAQPDTVAAPDTDLAVVSDATVDDAGETATTEAVEIEELVVLADQERPAADADTTREAMGNLPSPVAEDPSEASVAVATDGPVAAPTAQAEPVPNSETVADEAAVADGTSPGREPEVAPVVRDSPVQAMTETPETPAEPVAVAEPTDLPEPGTAAIAAQDAPGTLQSEARPEIVAEVQPEAPAPDVTDESGVLPTPDLAAAEAPARAPVLVADAAGVRVLQPAIAPGATADVLETVALDSIAYDDAGDVTLSGRAVGGGFVRVYVDNRPVIEATVGADGIWESGLPDVATGVYTMRVDQIDATGAVVSRIETPFLREEREAIAAVMAEETAQEGFNLAVRTVQPGNTLWAIARDRYGDGILYVEVFAANRDRIRNPDLIYPGQIFVLPELAAE